jgi:hypothetical protein
MYGTITDFPDFRTLDLSLNRRHICSTMLLESSDLIDKRKDTSADISDILTIAQKLNPSAQMKS